MRPFFQTSFERGSGQSIPHIWHFLLIRYWTKLSHFGGQKDPKHLLPIFSYFPLVCSLKCWVSGLTNSYQHDVINQITLCIRAFSITFRFSISYTIFHSVCLIRSFPKFEKRYMHFIQFAWFNRFENFIRETGSIQGGQYCLEANWWQY